jgi:hypothetical protein
MGDEEANVASSAWQGAMADARKRRAPSPRPRPARQGEPSGRAGARPATSRDGRRPDQPVSGPPVIDHDREADLERHHVAPADRSTAESRARRGGGAPSMQPDDWERVADPQLEAEATRAVDRGRRPAPPRDRGASRGGTGRGRTESAAVPETGDASVHAELVRAVGPGRVEKYEQRLKDASRAFEAERFTDAARILKRLSEDAPGAAAVRELYGLTLYRMERWRQAAKELEAFRLLGGSTEQHPVLADCYRALGRHGEVAALWDELKLASPSAELVTEGRIVMAGSLIDQRKVAEAVKLLEQGFSIPKRPKEHHLRRAYALADGYERAGEVVRARDLFGRIRSFDPWFADVQRRERALG